MKPIRRLRLALALLVSLAAPLAATAKWQTPTIPLRAEIDALNAAMVAAFKREPASVGTFYTDAAAIVGGGQRVQGRAGVDNYWKGAAMFDDWTLETLDTGGGTDAPWQYGRSVIRSRSGQAMQTFFVGLLRRQTSGELKFQIDAFTRERGDTGAEEAGKVFAAYLEAVEKADADALRTILDDQFVIVSGNSARDKAGEIADLAPASGGTVEYFRSDDTETRGFAALAVITGVLRWNRRPRARTRPRDRGRQAGRRVEDPGAAGDAARRTPRRFP